MTGRIKKSTELKNANISFVSIVDKAANQKQFAIVKSKNVANFGTFAPIVKMDDEKRLVTAIVYEPLEEDAHGDFMTEEEIEKAAHTFMENGSNIDIQHDFNKAEGITTVESWVTKEDGTIGDQEVKKGTWVITTKVENDNIWSSIKKGDLTGYSMAGIAERSTEDVNIEDVEKSVMQKVLSAIQKAFNLDNISKGEMRDRYEDNIKADKFWTAFWTLESILSSYDWWDDKRNYEEDPQKIADALADFNEIITEILTSKDIVKAIGTTSEEINKSIITKAGKTISAKNQDTIQSAYDALGSILDGLNNKEEDEQVEKQEVEKMISEAIQKALNPEVEPEVITQESITKMVQDAVKKATEVNNEPKEITSDDVGALVNEAVTKALEPILKARGISKQIDLDNDQQQVVKSSKSYISWGE